MFRTQRESKTSQVEAEIERRGWGGQRDNADFAGVVVVGSAAYRLVVRHHLEQM